MTVEVGPERVRLLLFDPHVRGALSEILRTTAKGRAPVGVRVQQVLRARKNLSSKRRRVVADAAYGLARLERKVDFLLEVGAARTGIAFAELDAAQQLEARYALGVMALEELPGSEVAGSGVCEAAARLSLAVGDAAARVSALGDPLRRLGVSASMPDWLVSELALAYGLEEADALLHAMNSRAPFALRANTLKIEPLELCEALAAEEVEAVLGSLAPTAVRLKRHVNVRALRAFRAGLFEPQDEGSQLICELVDPPRVGSVIDLCAGAGGKTLAIAAQMEGSGRILACDADWRRLGRMHPRLRRAGVSNVSFHKPGRPFPKSWAGRADRVLVDAPCSGTGALRRNPGSRWRLKPKGVDRLVRTQAGLLSEAAGLVRPGGRVIYATCSVLPRENDGVVAAFLDARPDFVLLPAAEILGLERAEGLGGGDVLRVLPHLHEGDGFYAAVLEAR